jgi:integrase/recombinase XerC
MTIPNPLLIIWQGGDAVLATVVYSPPPQKVIRVFDNRQLIERFEKWMLVVGYRANTRIRYIFSARSFAKFLVGKPITLATKADVREFVRWLYEKELVPVSIQSQLDALRVFFDFLQMGGVVSCSVPRAIVRRKLGLRLPRAKSEAEIEQIIKAAATVRDLAILELLYASGIRVSECAHLRIEEVNLPARSFFVREGKGGQDRPALFGRKAAKALMAYLGERKTGPLFLAEPRQQRGGVTNLYGVWWGQWRVDGVMQNIRLGDLPTRERAREALDAYLADKLPKSEKPTRGLTARSIHRIVVRAAKRAGIAGVHPHTFRHSFATHLLNRGVDIRLVMELLGHASLRVTQKYLHVAIERLQKVHELLER